MAKRNRSTLKNYFARGMMPTEEHFSDLIDSCVNQVEDGFAKPPKTGLQLTSLDQEHLLSFYRQSDPNTPLWHIGFASQQAKLHFTPNPEANITEDGSTREKRREKATLTLTPDGKVGINTNTPIHDLDVEGTISALGRVGGHLIDAMIPADGQWHDITPELEGCHIFDVVAGTGIRRSGRYALLRATAINTCAPNYWWWHLRRKNPIHTQQAYFHSAADKLKLRWKQKNKSGITRPYVLQIRSNTNYGENQFIRYHLTQLWHDPFMKECEQRPQDEQS